MEFDVTFVLIERIDAGAMRQERVGTTNPVHERKSAPRLLRDPLDSAHGKEPIMLYSRKALGGEAIRFLMMGEQQKGCRIMTVKLGAQVCSDHATPRWTTMNTLSRRRRHRLRMAARRALWRTWRQPAWLS